jgi:hypothetical protein
VQIHQATPASPPPHAPPPPPPPAPAGSDGEARASAATWLASLGALLLLAAAGTFLAVSWDALSLTARIAVVAAGTGAAIVGGLRLRRVLPAVGAVVFHLGALLVPVDALGLALQLDASPAGRWLAVGATGVVVLPLLAVAGRSRVLAWCAAGAVPILATGLALAGVVTAPVGVAAAALLVAVAATRAPDGIERLVASLAVLLASIAVHAQLGIAAVDAWPGSGGVVATLARAGWVPAVWTTGAVSGLLAVSALVLVASRLRSVRLAVLVVVPTVGLLLQLATAIARPDSLWAQPLRFVAGGVEVVAIPHALATAGSLLDPFGGIAVDLEYAASLALTALLWGAGSVRRVTAARRGVPAVEPLAPVLAGVAATVLAAASVTAGGDDIGALVVLLGAAIATLLWTELVPSSGVRVSTAAAAATVGAVLGGMATLLGDGHGLVLVASAGSAAVLGLHLWSALGAARQAAVALTWVLAPVAVLTLLLGTVLAPMGRGFDAATQVVLLLSLAALAHAIDRVPAAADSVRGVVALVGLLAIWSYGPTPVFATGGNASGADAVANLALVPPALVPAALALALLVAAVATTRRPWLGAFAAVVSLRVVIAAGLAVGFTVTAVAVVLVALVVVAAMAAVLTPRWRATTTTFAAVGAPLAWVLVGDARLARAVLLLAAGAVLVLAGVLRRQPVVGNLGAVVATLGTWDLLGAADVTAVDVWLLPVAVHLWVVADRARRGGRLTSSWSVDVPPLLLVVVPAVLERLAGGPGWHAVLAGAVAVAAVVLGGAARYAGPLVVGTVALLTVVLVETFAVVTAVPTWVWLAIGGAVLLGAAALVERTGGRPVRAARQLATVVGERFT